MGGQQGSRGYLYQGIVSIFSACAETGWDQISVEYSTPNDKVDIALMSVAGDVLKAIQVKSSVNLFTKENIKTWLAEIMDDVSAKEYQLILIGNCQESANKLIKSIEKFCTGISLDSEAKASLGSFSQSISEKNIKVLLLPFDESHLMGVVRDSLNRFISLQGYSIGFTSLEQISYALIALQMFLGTRGEWISRIEYEKRITQWLISSSNGEMKHDKKHSELEVKVVSPEDYSLANTGHPTPFSEIKSLQEYRNSILSIGGELIEKIEEIDLPAFSHLQDANLISSENIQKYTDDKSLGSTLNSFMKYKCSELPDTRKAEVKVDIQKYWNKSVHDSFFYVGNLTESTLFTSFTGNADYIGDDVEKCKNLMIHELIQKIQVIVVIDYLCEILNNVHLLYLCITNTGDTADKNITLSLRIPNKKIRVFSLTNEVMDDKREILDVMAETLIEEKIIEKALNIEATAEIAIEPEKYSAPLPFVMPDPFGWRKRYDYDALISEWEKYQSEPDANGIVTYDFSALRPGETKWLFPSLIIVPTTESFSIEYTILSESLGGKKSGTVEIELSTE